MAALVRRVAKQFGTPRFVITDHGTQFRRQFRSANGLDNWLGRYR